MRFSRFGRNSGACRLIVLLWSVLILTGVPGSAFAGGSQEGPEEGRAAGPTEGTITDIETTTEGNQILTVLRSDGSEVYVDVPDRLARTLRLQVGDRIQSEELSVVRPGERLQVQTLSVERG